MSRIYRTYGRPITAILLLYLLAGGRAHAEQPVIQAVAVESAPKIDGDIVDECWESASEVNDFFFVGDSSKAKEPTTAWLCYDQKCIYIAFKCMDSDPTKIVAQQKKRGGSLDTDDWVGFDLDCYGDFKKIVWFDVSAGGVQVESLQTGDASKIEWKGDWQGGAKRIDGGYTAEFAVPFCILQYNPAQTKMGIAFIRKHARLQQWWWSPNVGPNVESKRFYVWEGLKLPQRGNKPIVLGYALFGTGSDDAPHQAGVDIRHAITPSLNGLLTINPDFRSIEQQVDSVDFSYTERYLPDSRPFFQEGSNHFPMSNIFYTRRIEGIDAGAKVAGRFGEYGIGAMHAERFGEEHHNLVQVSRQWSDRTRMWLCGIESHTPTVNNNVGYFVVDQRVYGRGEGEIILSPTYAVAGSPENPGYMYGVRLSIHAAPRVLGWSFSHSVTEAGYDPYLGLVGEKDKRETLFKLKVFDNPSTGRVSSWYASLSATKANHLDGSLFYNTVSFYGEMEYRSGRDMYAAISSSDRPPNHDSVTEFGYGWGTLDLYRSGEVGFRMGKLAGGDYLEWSLSQGYQITDKLSLRGSYEFARIKDPSTDAFRSRQLVASLAYEINSERTLGGRLVSTQGRNNFYLAYKQRVRRGTDAYIIFGDPNADSTRSSVTVKLSKVL